MAGEGSRIRSRSRSPAPAEIHRSDFWHLQLEAIYRRENPTKLPQVPALLQKYAGNEAVLYAKVCKTYDLNPKVFHLDPREPRGSVRIDGVPILPNPPPTHGGGKEEDGDDEDDDDEEDEVVVTVSTMSGKEAEIAVQLRFDTVMQLRKDVAANLGIPVWASSLCMGTKVLEPDLALFDAGVAKGARLTLIRKPLAKLEKEFNKLRMLPNESESESESEPAQDPAATASNGSHDGLVYVVQDPQHEVLGVFKNRSVAVELAIERARVEVEEWLDDRFQDEEDATEEDEVEEHLDVRGARTSITWYKTDGEADDSDESGGRQVSLHRWSVQMFSIQ